MKNFNDKENQSIMFNMSIEKILSIEFVIAIGGYKLSIDWLNAGRNGCTLEIVW